MNVITGVVQFFSNEPLNGERQTTQALFGELGAMVYFVAFSSLGYLCLPISCIGQAHGCTNQICYLFMYSLLPSSPYVLSSPSLFLYLPLSPIGLLGALPLAAAIGVATGAFTCLFMFYESDVPGDFPPTPVSPRKATE